MNDETRYNYIDRRTGEKIAIADVFETDRVGNINLLCGHPHAIPDVSGVYLCIDENTTLGDIKQTWNKIEENRDEYYKDHGTRFDEGDVEFHLMRFHVLSKMFNLTVPTLCKYLNFEASVLLINNLEDEPNSPNRNTSQLKMLFEVINQGNDYISKVNDGKKSLAIGERPWNFLIGPLDEGKLGYKFGHFVDYMGDIKDTGKGKYRLLTLDEVDAYIEPVLLCSLKNIGYFVDGREGLNKADSLLQQSDAEMWKKNKSWIFQIMERIHWELKTKHGLTDSFGLD